MKTKKNEQKVIEGMNAIIDSVNEEETPNQRAPRLYVILNELIRNTKLTYSEAIGMLELMKSSLIQEQLNKINARNREIENKKAMRDYVG